MNAVLLRVRAKSGASPAIDQTALAFNEVIKGIHSDPNSNITALIKDNDKMKLIEALGSSLESYTISYYSLI